MASERRVFASVFNIASQIQKNDPKYKDIPNEFLVHLASSIAEKYKSIEKEDQEGLEELSETFLDDLPTTLDELEFVDEDAKANPTTHMSVRKRLARENESVENLHLYGVDIGTTSIDGQLYLDMVD